MESLLDGGRQVLGPAHHEAVLHDGPRDTDHVGFLEGILTDQVRSHLAGKHDHRNRVHIGGGDTCHGIGGARAGGHQYHARLASCARIAIRRMGGRLLMAHQHVGHLAVLEQRIVDVQYGSTRVAENVLNALVLEGPGDHLAPR